MENTIKKLRIDDDSVREAETILKEYKRGKAHLEARIVDDEEWFRMRNIRERKNPTDPAPASGWLFNAIAGKHSDAMDNYPSPVILPREEGDASDARLLSGVIPAILEKNKFESVWSDAWWMKLKHGTGCYGVFWSSAFGSGDIAIRAIDMLNIFYEPGINDIQKSRNLFHVELVDTDTLKKRWSVLTEPLSVPSIDISRYVYDDAVDTSGKAAVIDWYYKRDGLLHYCKFCAGKVLYASENDPELTERGFYSHGLYPFVLDTLYPIAGSPAGFGLIDVMRDAQKYIDSLDSLMLKNAMMSSRKRFFIRGDGAVNEEEFSDWTRDLVHVMGANLGEDSIREIRTEPLADVYVAILKDKIDELKEVTGNRDFNQGGVNGGVTAASAISALQEAGSRMSRDMCKSSWRAFAEICRLIIELIREFYDEPRVFRITGSNGEDLFLPFDNRNLKGVPLPFGSDDSRRVPYYDIRVSAERANPFSRVSQNELACEFYAKGFFDPLKADQALLCLSMMQFDGRDELIRRITRNAEKSLSVAGRMDSREPQFGSDPIKKAKMTYATGINA